MPPSPAASSAPSPPAGGASARERILAAAYELFATQGIRAVGIDAIIERSGVARMTLYRHFASKNALVLAFLEQRQERWTRSWLQHEVELRASEPRARLLAIFDVFDEDSAARQVVGAGQVQYVGWIRHLEQHVGGAGRHAGDRSSRRGMTQVA
jgi:AcrR family transcriptional regulator